MALDATVGGSLSDGYITVTEADAYNSIHPAAAKWTGSTTQKENAIKVATRWLDERVDWIGIKDTDAQALRWPRANAFNLDGFVIETTEIPKAVKNAAAELARHVLDGGDISENADGKGLTSLAVGSISLMFDKTDTADVLPTIVQEMLRGWGIIHIRSAFNTVNIVRA